MEKTPNRQKLQTEENDDDHYHSAATNIPFECDRCILADHRIFYLHRPTQRTYWEPPRRSWKCSFCLPYGFERAVDEFGTFYYINHLEGTTSYVDPRSTSSMNGSAIPIIPAIPPIRSYELRRSSHLGYGFVASSECPVVIQFVTPGGPSDGRLLPRDQILAVNGADVRNADKGAVIEMIRSSTAVLRMDVAQPLQKKESSPHQTPRRVRFTERITVAGSPVECGSLTVVPNVLRVFLENGQTKSFRFESVTTIQTILDILMDKLRITKADHFALAIEQPITSAPARLSLLSPTLRIETLIKSAVSSQMRCRLRIAFPPSDPINYSVDDADGFEYFYQQCVNDFVDGRFPEMRYEACLRLAALHIRQVFTESGALKSNGKININRVEKDYGLATFLPTVWLERIRPKDLRNHLQFFLRKDDDAFAGLEAFAKCQTEKTSKNDLRAEEEDPILHADAFNISRILRIKYVTIVSHLPRFSLRCFPVTYKPTRADMVMQIDSQQGVVVKYPGKNAPPTVSINFSLIDCLYVYPDDEMNVCVCFKLFKSVSTAIQRNLEFIVERTDADDLVMSVSGYSRLQGIQKLPCFEGTQPTDSVSNAPPYQGIHFVSPAGWNYDADVNPNAVRPVNLASGPPTYEHTVSTGFFPQSQPEEKPDEEEMGKSEEISANRRASGQQRLAQLLVGTANAILARNRNATKRIRDSLRVHRQRHSVPNAVPSQMSPSSERRWSTATRRATVASLSSSAADNPCVSRSALSESTDSIRSAGR